MVSLVELTQAIRALEDGKLVAFPTDTFFALGANALDDGAVKRVLGAKRRPADKPMPVLVNGAQQLDSIVYVDERTKPIIDQLTNKFWPGALTIVLPSKPQVPPSLIGGGSSLGVRVPDNPVALALLKQVPFPVVATSANLAGKQPVKSHKDLDAELIEDIACVVEGQCGQSDMPSTVIDLTGKSPNVLRTGAISLTELREVVPTVMGGDE